MSIITTHLNDNDNTNRHTPTDNQAALARIYSAKEVRVALDKLIEDKRVREATHRMCAWRVAEGDTGFQDDGEHGAGKVLLHLLETRHVSNQPIATSEPSSWHSTTLPLRLSPEVIV